jgi:hypothetical protein
MTFKAISENFSGGIEEKIETSIRMPYTPPHIRAQDIT